MKESLKKFLAFLLGTFAVFFIALTVVGIENGVGPFEVCSDILSKIASENPIAKMKEEAYKEGFNAGKVEGRRVGENVGYKAGYEDGFSDGQIEKGNELIRQGKTYDAGFRAGYKAGTNDTKDSENIYISGTSNGSGYSGNSGVTSYSGNSGTTGSSGTSGNNNNGGNTYYEEIAKECDYVLNKNTKKFHKPSCSSAAQIKDKNREYFTGTRNEVLSRGFEPCGRCNP